MELKRLKIDEEFRHLIRPLRHREFLQLEQNIINDGCRDPSPRCRCPEWASPWECTALCG